MAPFSKSNIRCAHPSRQPVLEELTCPLSGWFLLGFPSILTEVGLNMEKRQAPQDQRKRVRTNSGIERPWEMLPGPLLLVFLSFSLVSAAVSSEL